MNIELRNIKLYPRLSEETTAFSADVYCDVSGAWQKVGTAENNGKGGPNIVRAAQEIVTAWSQWAKAQPPHKSKYGPLTMDLDLHISLLIERHDALQQIKRAMRDRILITDGRRVLQTHKLTPEYKALLLANPAKLLKPGQRVLTEAEALELTLAQV